jgi:methyl-accepting chemotaxis protein
VEARVPVLWNVVVDSERPELSSNQKTARKVIRTCFLHHKADLQEIERFSCALSEANAKLEAISRSMAMIEFTPDGIVLDANENFCSAMGYSVEEVRGKHHRIFCEEAFYRSEEYANCGATWPVASRQWHVSALEQERQGDLARSQLHAGLRFRQTGQQRDKIASDISARVYKEHEDESMLAAIGRSMAVIEFTRKAR